LTRGKIGAIIILKLPKGGVVMRYVKYYLADARVNPNRRLAIGIADTLNIPLSVSNKWKYYRAISKYPWLPRDRLMSEFDKLANYTGSRLRERLGRIKMEDSIPVIIAYRKWDKYEKRIDSEYKTRYLSPMLNAMVVLAYFRKFKKEYLLSDDIYRIFGSPYKKEKAHKLMEVIASGLPELFDYYDGALFINEKEAFKPYKSFAWKHNNSGKIEGAEVKIDEKKD
jgi:hypothetical protein